MSEVFMLPLSLTLQSRKTRFFVSKIYNFRKNIYPCQKIKNVLSFKQVRKVFEILEVTNANREGVSIVLFFIAVILLLSIIIGKTYQSLETAIGLGFAVLCFFIGIKLYFSPV